MNRPVHSAHRVQVFFCEHCRFPHLVLFDEEDFAFAQAVIDRDIADSIMRCVEAMERGEHEPANAHLVS